MNFLEEVQPLLLTVLLISADQEKWAISCEAAFSQQKIKVSKVAAELFVRRITATPPPPRDFDSFPYPDRKIIFEQFIVKSVLWIGDLLKGVSFPQTK